MKLKKIDKKHKSQKKYKSHIKWWNKKRKENER
jgi:hypothetical protein